LIRILIADDHAIVRRGLREIIAEESDMRVVGEAVDGPDTLVKAAELEWDVLLLDLIMPGMHGIDVLARVRRSHPGLPVLVLSMCAEEEFGPRLMRAGAAGYLNKESAPEALIEAIRQVAGGGRYVSAHLAQLLARPRSGQQPLHAQLSERELQVLCHIASGRTLSQIAELMGLSSKTVSTYRRRLLVKMRMKSNAELTRYAVDHHLT